MQQPPPRPTREQQAAVQREFEQMNDIIDNQAAAAAAQQQQQPGVSWMSDPVLHAIIVVLSILCYLLFNKFQVLMEELRELNEALEQHQ